MHFCDCDLSDVIYFNIFDFSSRSKYSIYSTQVVFYKSIEKQTRLPLPVIGCDIFDFFSATAERNLTIVDHKQLLNFLFQVCVFMGRSLPLICRNILDLSATAIPNLTIVHTVIDCTEYEYTRMYILLSLSRRSGHR